MTTPYDIGAAIAQFDTEQLALEEVKVLCYPSGGAVDVILPLSTITGNTQNVKILVASVDGIAGGTITINGATPSGGAQELINGAATKVVANTAGYSSAKAEIATTGLWVANTNS